MDGQAKAFFDEWVRERFGRPTSRHLQNSVAENVGLIEREAAEAGIGRGALAAAVGGDIYRAVFDALAKALDE